MALGGNRSRCQNNPVTLSRTGKSVQESGGDPAGSRV